jgi:HEPN domain-containing protein
MNRSDFQKLARLRIKEAKHLLDGGYYDGAYYLAGYAIECALKACIAKQTNQYDFPGKKRTLDSYTHNLAQLVRVADLQDELEAAIQNTPSFDANWTVVQRWTEQSRYNIRVSEAEARDLIRAITSPTDGVLSWLKERW